MRRKSLLSLVCILAGFSANADSIIIDDTLHENVIVRESAALYYVQDPASGTVFSVAKDKVADGAFVASTDEAERNALLAAWKEARPTKQIEAPNPVPAASAEAEGDPTLPRLSARGDAARSDGRVPYLRLKNVPLGDALDATLRPLNLDYTVAGGFLYISSPERIAHESFERMETRTYNVNLNETLPKIVVSNRFGAGSVGQRGGNLGSGGFGAAGGGGLGNQQGSAGGIGAGGGGFGGGNQGAGGGFNGGGGRNVQDVTAISNISDLFSTVDDRLVGESPAQIGLAVGRR